MAAALISPDGGQAHAPRGQRMDEDAWPGVKTGQCDENALRVLRLLIPTLPLYYWRHRSLAAWCDDLS